MHCVLFLPAQTGPAEARCFVKAPLQTRGEKCTRLPAALLEGYTLTLLEADGAESELPFAVEDEEISFTLDFTPVEDEEPVPVRVIRLIPVAG